MNKLENTVTTQELLINGLSREIIKGINNYLEKQNMKKSEIEISMEIQTDSPYEMKVITTIKKRKLEVMKNGQRRLQQDNKDNG